jgi:hypothetical protein
MRHCGWRRRAAATGSSSPISETCRASVRMYSDSSAAKAMRSAASSSPEANAPTATPADRRISRVPSDGTRRALAAAHAVELDAEVGDVAEADEHAAAEHAEVAEVEVVAERQPRDVGPQLLTEDAGGGPGDRHDWQDTRGERASASRKWRARARECAWVRAPRRACPKGQARGALTARTSGRSRGSSGRTGPRCTGTVGA